MQAGSESSLSDEERLDWLRLIRSDNVGPHTFHLLVKRYGSVRTALEALPELARRGGALRRAHVYSRTQAERELARMNAMSIALLAVREPHYPARLQTIEDAPPLLAVRGNLDVLRTPTLAIVGARNASAAGMRFAERLARELAEAGFAIVSGLARGIDAAAHRATVSSGTIAVLAGGHGEIYPPEHTELAEAICSRGALVSEMAFSWQPRARDFPRRNRLISGMAAGVVIIEAAKRSGSLITARFALEQGREVFAVPGSPVDPRAEGCNDLIKEGATLVTRAEDVISVLHPMVQRTANAPEPGPEALSGDTADPDSEERTRILNLLGPTPVLIDDVIRLSRSSPAAVRTAVLELELAGRIERHGNGLIALVQS
jgi:DNA processing protein